MKRRIVPGEIPTKDMHQYLLGSVAPRPIAFVSTKDEHGHDNIAPYSFFNVFSSNPPIAVFSSNRKVADNTTKDTLHNVKENMECVINVVNYDIVRQMALSSVAFPAGVSEFDKTGLTPIDAEFVDASLLSESPVNMECKVKEIITLGEHGGAGHLIICDILLMHIDERVIDGDRINPSKIDLVGRMGRSYYTRASGDAIFTLYQPVVSDPIGYDALPDSIKCSDHLTGNEIGELASIEDGMPTEKEIAKTKSRYKLDTESDAIAKAKKLIKDGEKREALCLLL